MRGYTFFDRFIASLMQRGSVRRNSKHIAGRKPRNWREKRKTRRKIAKESKKKNRRCS